jgi:hypothetical protein
MLPMLRLLATQAAEQTSELPLRSRSGCKLMQQLFKRNVEL